MAVFIAFAGFLLVCFGAWLFLPGSPVLPVISAGDWPPLILMFLGSGWAVLGGIQFLRYGSGMASKFGLVVLMLASLGVTGLTSAWVLDLSYRLPAAPSLEAEPLPAFELVDQHGVTHTNLSLRGKPVVMIFGRGVW